MIGRNAVFRVDASLQMGSGHVMRCLTLAQALRAQGVECTFACRAHVGHLIMFIRDAGFAVEALAVEDTACSVEAPGGLAHAHWLGASQEADAVACLPLLERVKPQWLIVDHYSLDKTWEALVADHAEHILVIDDLADRAHYCHLLLDQNLGRKVSDYASLVPAACRVLVGPIHALLRPEFALLRDESLQFRKANALNAITIAMGGVDEPNATGKVLASLSRCPLSADTHITVIMGGLAPALDSVRQAASLMPWPTRVLVGINNVAEVLASSDLVIGAVGGSAWERCALGVPTLMVVLAENQRPGAMALAHEEAGLLIGEVNEIESELPRLMAELCSPQKLRDLSVKAASLTDGYGVFRVLGHMSL